MIGRGDVVIALGEDEALELASEIRNVARCARLRDIPVPSAVLRHADDISAALALIAGRKGRQVA